MTNFDFLKKEKQFATFAEACIEAEKSISVSPALSALGVRKSAELAVKWLYSVDDTLRLPYKDNFSALVYNPSFTESIDAKILNCLRYIIKLGNFSAHTNKQVTYKEAVLALANLFALIQFIDYCYGKSYTERTFDESILAADKNQSISNKEWETLKDELSQKTKERESLAKEMDNLKAELAELRKKNEAAHTFAVSAAAAKTEADTRRTIIDVDIKEMGWTFGEDCLTEVPVSGMPSLTGDGRADYVLYGNNHKPLAVVEAKKTGIDAEVGREQARLYADCLEQMTGQRPLIFYTNGYTTWFWDDTNYAPRKVYSVFAKRDMERIMNRRNQKKPFRQLAINDDITNRPYQKIAIQRACNEYGNNKRKVLWVMATGSGKTRTVISLIDVLLAHNYITNILFLADRIDLVRQAKKAFTRHMPNLSTCNLLERGDDKPTDRAIFSTYPTIMNAIDDMKTADGQKLFTPAHFDLIVIDEAHRSIFKKYRAIFEYFDALLIGLTATPKTDVDHNTYDFFDLENDMPTFAYEYEEALANKYLADYHCIEKLYSIPTEGISYDKLSPEDRERYEDAFDEDDDMPEFISSSEMDRVYFNANTTQRVLTEIMLKGIKVDGGDKLGKTIIFAKNHNHAEFIKKQFDKLYPEYKGHFARVIDNKEKYRKKLLEDFEDKDKFPQIAISVDMLDTGIDVPEILNLVFYKPVFSKAKFWQMFGRGTRLCADLFGPGEDKKEFYIFDYMGNCTYFANNPKGKEVDGVTSLSELTFSLKVKMMKELQAMEYQQSDLIGYRKELVDEAVEAISALNPLQFQVRQNLEYVEKFSSIKAFECLEVISSEELVHNIAPLIPAVNEDESAKRLDVIMYRMMLSRAQHDDKAFDRYSRQIRLIAVKLSQKATIPDVMKAKDTLTAISTEEFWQNASIMNTESIRKELRGLMQYLKKEMKLKEINITDAVIFEREGERLGTDNTLDDYYERASRYVKKNENTPVLVKLKNNLPLDDSDISTLEEIFWHEVGSQEEYRKMLPEETQDMPLGKFVRSLTGLTQEAAQKAFSAFLDESVYNEAQIGLVKCIMDWLVQNGTMDRQDLSDSENLGGLSIGEVFEPNMIKNILAVIDGINTNAAPKAA